MIHNEKSQNANFPALTTWIFAKYNTMNGPGPTATDTYKFLTGGTSLYPKGVMVEALGCGVDKRGWVEIGGRGIQIVTHFNYNTAS